jgi:hypothetical protein
MKTATASGCIVGVVLFFLLSACLLPIGVMAAGFTSHTDFVVETMGGYLCPVGTTPDLTSYATTILDERQVEMPATAYELICVDESGQTLVNRGPTYAFIWTGLLGAAGVLLALLLALIFAAPAGILAARVFGRKKTADAGRVGG